MDQQYGIGAIAFALFTGFISSWIFWKFQLGRKKAIRQKIEDLNYEDTLLDKLSTDNFHLLRYSFQLIFVSLFLFFSANFAASLVSFLEIEGLVLAFVRWLITLAYGIAAFGCYETAKTFLRLKNFEQSKEKIRAKIQKYQEKLEE